MSEEEFLAVLTAIVIRRRLNPPQKHGYDPMAFSRAFCSYWSLMMAVRHSFAPTMAKAAQYAKLVYSLPERDSCQNSGKRPQAKLACHFRLLGNYEGLRASSGSRFGSVSPYSCSVWSAVVHRRRLRLKYARRKTLTPCGNS